MGPQCEDGYTAIANELLEALCRIRIPGESTQVFLTILRKTYGYKKVVDRISLSQFVTATGMQKPNICRALKQLETLNVIEIDKLVGQNDNTCAVMYRINKHYETWEIEKRKKTRLEPLSKRIITVVQNDNASLSKTITNVVQKDTHKRKKETDTKEKASRFSHCEAWHAFKEMRKRIKRPLTCYAETLIVKKLHDFQAKGHDPTEVLNASIEHSWQGVFEPKDKGRDIGAKPDPQAEYRQTEADLRAKGLIE